jgi:hypothetical protein
MSKFSAVDKVAPATEPVEFEVGRIHVKCLVRHMMAEDERLVLVGARDFARQNGVQSPSPTDPLYLLGLVVSTVHRGFVDADAPEQLFFDGGVDQIRACLDRERITHLWALQADFQDRMSGIAEPPPTDGELILWVQRLTGAADDSVFAELRPRRMRLIMRGLAQLAVRTVGLLTDLAKASPEGTAADGESSERGLADPQGVAREPTAPPPAAGDTPPR